MSSRLRPFHQLVVVILVAVSAACSMAQTPRLTAVRFKNLGVAYLEEARPAEAERAFQRVIELAPAEALGYANLGVALLRLGEIDRAASQLEQARRVSPRNVEVLLLGAEVQYAGARWDGVIRTARQVLAIEPANAMGRYYIYRACIAQRGDEAAQREAARQIAALYEEQPKNLVVAIRHARYLADRQSWQAVAKIVESIGPATLQTETARRVLAPLAEAVKQRSGQEVEYLLAALENVLRPTQRFRNDLFQLQPPVAGLPLEHFSKPFRAQLDQERPRRVEVAFTPLDDAATPPATGDADVATRGNLQLLEGEGGTNWWLTATAAAADDPAGRTALWSLDGGTWRDALSERELPPASDARLVDLDDDGRWEIVAVGPRGTVLLSRQGSSWENVLDQWQVASLPGRALAVIDIDNEGDLDLCLAGRQGLAVWQNRPNQTLANVGEQTGLAAIGGGARQLIPTDHDDDLDTDLLVLGADGHPQLWDNRRHGRFARLQGGLIGQPCRHMAVGDLDHNGFEDLVLAARSGRVLVQHNARGRFATAVPIGPEDLVATHVLVFDCDNDGWLDVAAAGRQGDKAVVKILRNGADGTWEAMDVPRAPERCLALATADLDRDGDLDLVALDPFGNVRGWRNTGGNANHWLRVRLKGLQVAGSKNNVNGIGSKLEIKAGLFYGLQYVRAPVTHFGLGSRQRADILRVMWSNGVPQNRFDPTADQTIREVQVLKGSCPYLYCWNGDHFEFVTDTLAAAPLGLQVADGVLAPDNPRELLTIPPDKIAPRGDQYVFQYTSELWETVYLDQVSLWAVDHPAAWEVFTDQRFLPPPYDPPQPILTRTRVEPVRAFDSRGRDVTASLLDFDYRYPQQLQPTRYQGLVEPHRLTLDFGDVSQLNHPLLILKCWIFWTDTSINVAVSQDPQRDATPTQLEVWDPRTGWQAIRQPFGLPNGKNKWVVIDLADRLCPSDARVRITSQSEIYWDQAFLADRARAAAPRITRLAPSGADLHFGGFNQLYRPAPNAPHLYHYGRKTSQPIWMTMTGWATRYGDVTALLQQPDDRFVIFTGGDEVTVRFDATRLPPVPSGWKRSFLFYNVGWEKDSDRNTLTGQTVEPLPFHGMSAYPYPADESYPRSPAHCEYRRRYNTRRLGPEKFREFVKQYDDSAPRHLPWDHEPAVRGDHSQ